MRMAEKNIQHVSRRTKDGKTYGFTVGLKNHEIRDYAFYEHGKTTDKYEMSVCLLPVAAQKFVKNHKPEVTYEHQDENGSTYIQYIYKDRKETA